MDIVGPQVRLEARAGLARQLEAKAALRQEVGLADDYANLIGREVCAVLLHHRLRIQAAIGQYVEPQIAAMLEELTRSLDAPFDPNAEPGMPEP